MSKVRLFSEGVENNEKIILERIESCQAKCAMLEAEVLSWQQKPLVGKDALLRSLENIKIVLDKLAIIEPYFEKNGNSDSKDFSQVQQLIEHFHKKIIMEVEISLSSVSSQNLIPRSAVYRTPEKVYSNLIDLIAREQRQINDLCRQQNIATSTSMLSKDHPLKTLRDALMATSIAITAATGSMVADDYSELQNKHYLKLEKNLTRSENLDLVAADSTLKKAGREIAQDESLATIMKIMQVETKQINLLKESIVRDEGQIEAKRGQVDKNLEDLPPPSI